MGKLALAFLCALGCALPLLAQAQGLEQAQAPVKDGVSTFVDRIGTVLASGKPSDLEVLLSPNAGPPAGSFIKGLFVPDTTRVVVRERDRAPLQGALPGDGYRLILEVFTETATRGRIITTRLDVRRPRGSDDASWRIAGAEALTNVEGLHRLRVSGTEQFAARNLVVTSEDLELRLASGAVFQVDSAEGTTGLILIGEGEMVFSPTPETERTQVRIFGGADTLTAKFEQAFVRFSPQEYQARVTAASLSRVPVDRRQLRRAQAILAAEGPKSFSLDLSDLSPEPWYLIPAYGDFLAEVRTNRHGTLTYARATGEAEDISLFERTRRRNIALYASAQKLASRGRFYNEDDLVDYDVVDYNIETAIEPEREFVQGRARLRMRVRAHALATLTVRLADPLVVHSVASAEHGRLMHLRVRNQNSIVINLPTAMPKDAELNVVIAYSGRIQSQGVDREAIQLSPQRPDDMPMISAEPNFLLSNRAYWYPQAVVSDYATATLQVTVPEGHACVASGEPAGPPVPIRSGGATQQVLRRRYTFHASDPVRYLALVVSRFARVTDMVLPLADGASSRPHDLRFREDGTRIPGFRVRDRVALGIEANPRQISRAKDVTAWASDILRFYTSLLGDAPYQAVNFALLEHDLPGGHSPGYAVFLNNPLPTTPFVWRNDPATFASFPEFFVAHEIAHQWWGQAVGWMNYHEQWLSEGFAQYFSALYAQKQHGDDAFVNMLRQFRRWAIAESDQGPVYLGYRLGHIRNESRVFRALIYNKGAAVLHMLRRLLGDETFFRGLRRFYHEQQFQKAGTVDLQRAMEAESSRNLERFFEKWIYGTGIPRLRYQSVVGEREVVVRLQQAEDVFDLAVTITITYADGRIVDSVVPVTEARVEHRIQVDGIVRQVQINRDGAAIAHFDES